MFSRFRHALRQLDLEERILNGGALIAITGLLMPWLGGEWLGGDPVSYSGFGFYTSFMGLAIFVLHSAILFSTFSPLMGGPSLIHKKHTDLFRLCCAAQATILALASLSVLARVTFEFSRVGIRFGIYVTLVGGLISALYAFLKLQEGRRHEVEELFYHTKEEEVDISAEREAVSRRDAVEQFKDEAIAKIEPKKTHSIFNSVEDDSDLSAQQRIPEAPEVEEHTMRR
jgi:hypothetical protein